MAVQHGQVLGVEKATGVKEEEALFLRVQNVQNSDKTKA